MWDGGISDSLSSLTDCEMPGLEGLDIQISPRFSSSIHPSFKPQNSLLLGVLACVKGVTMVILIDPGLKKQVINQRHKQSSFFHFGGQQASKSH